VRGFVGSSFFAFFKGFFAILFLRGNCSIAGLTRILPQYDERLRLFQLPWLLQRFLGHDDASLYLRTLNQIHSAKLIPM
jgi:hypothetical protein